MLSAINSRTAAVKPPNYDTPIWWLLHPNFHGNQRLQKHLPARSLTLLPNGSWQTADLPQPSSSLDVDVFFIHGTQFLKVPRNIASLNSPDKNSALRQVSAFRVGTLYAPFYRQATFATPQPGS